MENPQVKTKSNDKPIRSNAFILKIFSSSTQSRDDILHHLHDPNFQDKMKNILNYWRPQTNEDINILANRRLLNRYPLTKTLTDLISKISNDLNLGPSLTFEILDSFFQTSQDKLEKMIKNEDIFKTLSADKDAEARGKLMNYLLYIEHQVIGFYYSERINLLKLFYIFVKRAFNELDPISDQFKLIFDKLNKEKSLVKSLWEQFKFYSPDHPINKTIDIKSRELHSLQILSEQRQILECIMLLSFHSQTVNAETYMDMLTVMSSKRYMGYYYDVINEYHIEEYHHDMRKHTEILQDQSMLVLLGNLNLSYLSFTYSNELSNEGILTNSNFFDKMPFELFKLDVQPLIQFFHNASENNYSLPVCMAIIAICKMIKEKFLQRGLNVPESLSHKIKNFEDKIEIDDQSRYDSGMPSLIDLMSRETFFESESSHQPKYKLTLRSWLNLIIKYYYNSEFNQELLEMCVRMISALSLKDFFWQEDYKNETPIGECFIILLNSYSLNSDLLTAFCYSLINTEDKNSVNSLRLFHILSDLKFCTKLVDINEIKITNEDIVYLQYPTLHGFRDAKGTILKQTEDDKYLVRFEIEPEYSMFVHLYQKWGEINKQIGQLLQNVSSFTEDMLSKIYTEDVEYVRLFCTLIATNTTNIDTFMNTICSDDNVLSYDQIIEQYSNILSHCFESLNVINKNWQVYTVLSPLSVAIYKMLSSFLSSKRIKRYALKAIVKNFTPSFHSTNNDRYVTNTPVKALFNRPSIEVISLIDLFTRTLNYDISQRKYTNTIYVLKVIKSLFKFPNILDFFDSKLWSEFLYNVWQHIIVKYMQITLTKENFQSIEEFIVTKQLVKIITNSYKIITHSANNATILELNLDFLFNFMCSCLNLFEPSEFILFLLRTNVYHGETKDRIVISNSLWDNFIQGGNIFYHNKIETRGLLVNVFKCLNGIFDLVLFYRNLKDEYTKKNYSRIDTIRKWEELFFVTKVLPVSESRNFNTTYEVNLFINIFSYVDFEDRELLEFQTEDRDPYIERSLWYDDLLALEGKKLAKDSNVSTLSLQSLCRILVLFESQDPTLNSKVSNIMNYFNIKKVNSSELEPHLNLLEKFKETLYILLSKPQNHVMKVEVVKFLSVCANSQIGFMSCFLDDVKIKSYQHKKFLDIFVSLASSPFGRQESEIITKIKQNRIDNEEILILNSRFNELLGHLCILTSNLISSDVIFKKIIHELLTTFKGEFTSFLNMCMERFTISDYMSTLNNLEIMNKSEFNFNYEDLVNVSTILNEVSFKNVVVKGLSLIFSKLIVLTEIIDGKTPYTFEFGKELRRFLTHNIAYVLSEYNCRLNSEFINEFNDNLTKEISFNDQHSIEWLTHNYKERTINIKANERNLLSEKDSKTNHQMFYLPFIINSIFGYSIHYWVDLRQLLTSMRARNYKESFFIEYMPNLIRHNVELSMLSAKFYTITSVSYLLSLIFSIGPGNHFLTANMFTNDKTLQLITKAKEFVPVCVAKDNVAHPKLGFNLMNQVFLNSPQEFNRFFEETILKNIVMNRLLLSGGVMMEIKSDEHESDDVNYCNQYIYPLYSILTNVVDYVMYLRGAGLSSIMFQKQALQILTKLSKDFNTVIRHIKENEIEIHTEKCILSMLNLIYSSISFLLSEDYEFQQQDINDLNLIIKNVIICMDKTPAYQAIIIFIICAYASIDYFVDNPSQSLIFNSNEIIGLVLKKLVTKLNPQEYLAIITFFITLVDKYKLSIELLKKEKVLLALLLNDRFPNDSSLTEYEENERGVNHILWCWTLILMRQVALRLNATNDPELYSMFKFLLDFLLNHQERILTVLNSTQYVDVRGNHLVKSLAFLEELEYLLSLLNVIFIQSNKWKNQEAYLDFYNQVVTTIMTVTIKLYIPNIRISNHFKAFSNNERDLMGIGNEVFIKDIGITSSTGLEREHQSVFSPLKKFKASSFKENVTGPSTATYLKGKHSINYNTQVNNLFLYRVDQCLNNILYSLTNIVKSALYSENVSNKTSYRSFITEVYKGNNLSSFDEQCQDMVYALYYAIHSMDNLTKNYENYENMYWKAFVYFNNICSNVNFGNLNLVYVEDKFEQIFLTNNATLQNILLINTQLGQLLTFFQNKYNFDNQLKDATLRKLDLIGNILHERDQKVTKLKGVNDALFNHVRNSMK